MSADTPSKDSFLPQIWSICSTLTQEALTTASTKSKEAGFDPDRGLVPLAESFNNLLSARAILEDAIEKLLEAPASVSGSTAHSGG